MTSKNQLETKLKNTKALWIVFTLYLILKYSDKYIS